MRRLLLPAVFALVTAATVAAGPADEPVFKFDGKTYAVKDLPASVQQQLYDVRIEAYTRTEQLAEQEALSLYFDAEAKKSGKTRAVVEAEQLAGAEPTDKQVTEWYEANKARIPPGYALEKISGEIKTALREQYKREKRDQLIAKLKKDGKIVMLAAEPAPPLVQVQTAGFPVKGKADAKVTLVEFADYQCPHCKGAAQSLDDLLKKYEGKVKLVYLDYPIKGEYSELAAQGAFCAGEQGKFWEFHDLAFQKQGTLASKFAASTLAKELKLDDAKFEACFSGDAAKKQVAKAKSEGDRVGLTGTPTIYINGRRVRGYEPADLDKEIQRALKGGQS